ncbi:MAG TPA: hypothetical protein VNH18_21320, partial [Bryobacteraceae bacterium]|nr:hypothetical protein [Bryobacteraceae bacterium]
MFQVITEFGSGTPTPQITQTTSDGTDTDDFLDFGSIQMGQGFAFALGDETNKVRVAKHWAVLSGRTCLIEQVPFTEVAPVLQNLGLPPAPPATGSIQPKDSIINRLADKIVLPEPKLARKESKSLKLVSKPLNTHGFAMDFNTLTSSTNWVFTADSTTYVSGLCSLFGSNVWEGGCVLKFATNASILLNPAFGTTPTTSFRGSIYRPIIITAKDDNSCGQTITGSSGSPSGYYASPAFNIAALATQNITGMRFCYAKQAISIGGNSANIYHSQFVNCQSGLSLGGGTVHLRNVLFANVVTNIIMTGGMTVTVENGTFSGSSYLATGPSSSGSSLSLVNCILANVTNLSAGVFTLSGDYDGFYQTTTFGTHISTTSTSPFQTIGAGNFYLTVGNSFRNAGTTNIDSTLLNDLTNRTTFPPNVVWLTQITTNMLLSPQIQRDNSPTTRDLGWHYDALDWAVGDSWMFSANSITATPGTAIGGFGTNYSFGIAEGAQVNFTGTPNSPVRLVAFNTVQEQPSSSWKEVTSGYGLITDYFGLPASAALNFRFTDFSILAQDELFVYAGTVPGNFQDCQLHGGQLWGEPIILNLTNCLFERVYTVMFTTDTNLPTVRNNTFFGGTFGYAPNNTNGVVRDNLFDHTTFFFNPVYGYLNFNAYVTNCDRLTNANDIILPASPAYQAGPLENFYLLSGSTLINADTSLTADTVGLYHYTVTTNLANNLQIKETNSLLDIGFHAVAVDANGVPIDTDTGGAPDYLENPKGDGSTNNAGETNWKNSSDDSKYLLVPQYLRCEYRQNPWGITTTYGQPRFYWTVSSPSRGDKQVAYQVIVGSTSNNAAAGRGDVWDSGKQFSDQTIHVPFGGSLQTGQRLWWNVRAWDLYTGLSAWATNGSMFQVGLLSSNDADWSGANWIGVTPYSPNHD